MSRWVGGVVAEGRELLPFSYLAFARGLLVGALSAGCCQEFITGGDHLCSPLLDHCFPCFYHAFCFT